MFYWYSQLTIIIIHTYIFVYFNIIILFPILNEYSIVIYATIVYRIRNKNIIHQLRQKNRPQDFDDSDYGYVLTPRRGSLSVFKYLQWSVRPCFRIMLFYIIINIRRVRFLSLLVFLFLLSYWYPMLYSVIILLSFTVPIHNIR